MDAATKEKKTRTKFEIDKTGFFAEAAVMMLCQSVIFRLIGSIGMWNNEIFTATQLLLPMISCILLVLCITLLGKRLFVLSFIPVFAGAAFFIIRSLGFESMLLTVLCIVFCVFAATLYTFTVFGIISAPLVLSLLFAIPFVYKLFFVDLAALRDTLNPVYFADGTMEMSALCMIAAMIFVGVGLKKRAPEQVELPKIKDPVVIAPVKPELASEPEIAAMEETAEAEEEQK